MRPSDHGMNAKATNMEISRPSISLILKGLLASVLTLGYDAIGLLLGAAIFLVPLAQVRQWLVRPAVVKPAPLVPAEIPRPELPPGVEPAAEAIHQYNRWLKECVGDCSKCSFLRTGWAIPCGIWAGMRDMLPSSDPFVTVLGAFKGRLNYVELMVGLGYQELRINNGRRRLHNIAIATILTGVLLTVITRVMPWMVEYILAVYGI